MEYKLANSYGRYLEDYGCFKQENFSSDIEKIMLYLERMVGEMINQGYTPQGGIVEIDGVLIQPMVKN
jgi:hypothetical protein